MVPGAVTIGYHDIKSMSRCQSAYLILHVNFEEISFTLVEPLIVLKALTSNERLKYC